MTTEAHTASVPAGADAYRLRLTDAEREELAALARKLTETAPALVDDPGWLAAARHLSSRLPVRLLDTVRTYRHDPGADGTLLLSGLPIDEDALPDTPDVAESVQREATVPAATAVLIGLQLGEIVAYREEKSGALVQNVVPVRGLEASQSNAGSVPLEFHIENAFHPYRPDFVGLTCLRQAVGQNAGTTVASIRRALPLIEESDRRVLHQARFVTVPPPSFRSGSETPARPVLDGSPDDPNIVVDFHATTALDDEAKQVLERLRATMMDISASVELSAGELVFVDNRVVLHGRAPFTPNYDGRDRWLQRIFVHLDNRRTRVLRADNGAVMT
ncbi:malate synthase [Streptomyces sp. NBRC 110611]|uniref:TauD/TfdA family dioxygenase n=1 Tax=Streptomyces sp. NBRC 110611 TaxID=1621259 RepID=UPI00083264B4|nr:TauD/TfdA family dioxygenase [Streptomyces sp. NBRC 110611]GAU68938.1 malate synthase [Streptomyces sp. NBRC 110611]